MAIKILIFDDDELIRMTLTNFFRQEGFEVDSFDQPNQCPLYYSDSCGCQQDQACADIIITDLNMPGMNGINFIEKQRSQGCKVKHVALMSGDWGDSGLDRARELGCKIFKKPFSILDMKKWLNDISSNIQEKKITMPITFCEQLKENKKARKFSTDARRLPLMKQAK